ncbi:MAG TPA: peptide chain release factor N(5)-glutamine methyltransferase [Bacilli bacterium]|nr:peptide chain release factor N(5)-glutamine methyltransferase [Bacilli bacterium]
MTIEELIVYGKKYIHKDQVILLLSSLLEINYFDVFKDLNKKLEDDIIEKFKKLVEGIRNNTPIQYLLGETDFYGYKFKVNENVLIPRFETEYLVQKAYKLIKDNFNDNIDIVDIGTGSGIIAITLKKLIPQANIAAVDISKKAIDIAKENAKVLNTDITFIEGNMLDPLTKRYDVLISNPPYIPIGDEVDISTSQEPDIALYGGIDGYKFYREIIEKLDKIFKDKILIAFEIGSRQNEEIVKIIKGKYPNAIIKSEKDLNNLDRYIFAMIKK